MDLELNKGFSIPAFFKRVPILSLFYLQFCNPIALISHLQMIRVAFDEDEVSQESIENFRKCFQRSRWPPSVYNTFAFNYKTAPVLQRTLSQRQHSIRKTHRSLTSVVQLKKIAAGRDSNKGMVMERTMTSNNTLGRLKPDIIRGVKLSQEFCSLFMKTLNLFSGFNPNNFKLYTQLRTA